MVLEDLAVRFEDDRERIELASDLEEVGRLAALEPERGAGSGSALRQQKCPPGGLPEPGGIEGAVTHFGQKRRLDLVGAEQDLRGVGWRVDVGEAKHHAVVRPDEVDVGAVLLPIPVPCRQRPGRMNPRSERGQDDQPPVADLVAEAFHHDRGVGGEGPGGFLFLGDKPSEIGRCPRIEPVALAEPRLGLGAVEGTDLADEGTDGSAQLQRSPRGVSVPEGHPAGCGAGGRLDEHSVERDLLDAPGRGSEDEHVAGSALVHHLLVELTDPPALRERHGEQTSVGNGAGICDGQNAGVAPTFHGARHPIPDDAGA